MFGVKNMKQKILNLVYIIIGNIFIALAVNTLILENHIIVGGTSGIGNVLNHYFNMEISYIYIGIISVLLSFIGQIGDLAASAIKRTNGIKDFSNLIPGHGGMLDRFDSVIAIAPFAYFFLTMIVNIGG